MNVVAYLAEHEQRDEFARKIATGKHPNQSAEASGGDWKGLKNNR